MVNTAMTTQMALDRFEVVSILFSGIAGSVESSLDIGNVVVAERLGQYFDAGFARKTAEGDFATPGWMSLNFVNFGMIYTRAISLKHVGGQESQFWLKTDPALLEAAARAAEQVSMEECTGDTCLSAAPEVVVGGSGVSGSVFVDRADFREHVSRSSKRACSTWRARRWRRWRRSTKYPSLPSAR